MCATTKYVSEVAMSIGTAPRKIPDRPPITNMETNPSAHNIGVAKLILPSQVVASQEKTLIPVGTAISSVVIIIGIRSQGAIPATNMVSPDREAQDQDRDQREGHQPVAENRLARHRRDHLRGDPEARGIMM